MKKFAVVLVLVITVLAVAVPMFAQDNVVPAVSGTGVNIRSGAGTEYSLRGGLIRGSLTITGRNDFDTDRICTGFFEQDLDMWLRVDYNGVEGWVALCTVDVNTDVSAIPVVSASHPILISDLNYDDNPSAVELGDRPETFVFGTTRARVNMRTGAGLDNSIITELRGGEMVYVTDVNSDGSWVKVQVEDNTGWVARYLMNLPKDWQDTFAEES